MISNRKNRLDPSLLDNEEREELKQLVRMLSTTGHPALVDEAGSRIDLPKPVFTQLLRVLRMMEQGRAIVMLPEDETFTTQAAANFLGMSRQHLVDLLEDQKIPFHRVGSHRRVYFRDLLEFDQQRNTERRAALDKIFDEVDEAGLYDSTLPAEDQ